MNNQFEEIIDSMEFPTRITFILWDEIKELCRVGNTDQAMILIQSSEENIDGVGIDREQALRPFCNIYKAYIHLKRNKYENAALSGQDAVCQFRVYFNNATINNALAQWFLGCLFFKSGHESKAFHEMVNAKNHLQLLSQLYDMKEYTKREKCLALIEKVTLDIECCKYDPLEEDREHSSKRDHPAAVNQETEEKNGYFPDTTFTIALPWLPIVDTVQAGAKGPELVPSAKPEFTALPYVILNDHTFALNSIRSGMSNITLKNGHGYAWAPVKGKSMNQSIPVHIEDGDYILFESIFGPQSRVLQDNDIVIVARDGVSEWTYMVKRYRMIDNIVVSETDQKGPEYDPFSLSMDARIVGIVIAVAKRISC